MAVYKETLYYLAVQDGRLDNEEYYTYGEAKEAKEKLGDFGKGVCIMSYCHETPVSIRKRPE